MDGVNIEAMRAAYRTVRKWGVSCGEWSESEADEMGLAIKQAIADQDAGYLAWWAEWLSTWAEVAELLTRSMERLHTRELQRLRAGQAEAGGVTVRVLPASAPCGYEAAREFASHGVLLRGLCD
jgi:hypothetical protein